MTPAELTSIQEKKERLRTEMRSTAEDAIDRAGDLRLILDKFPDDIHGLRSRAAELQVLAQSLVIRATKYMVLEDLKYNVDGSCVVNEQAEERSRAITVKDVPGVEDIDASGAKPG